MKNVHLITFMTKSCVCVVLAFAALFPAAVKAQNLHTELEVDREIVPIEIESAPLRLTPSVTLPAFSTPRLNYSNQAVTTPAPNDAATLQPIPYSLKSNSMRGWVEAGFFPQWNALIRAKYDIFSNSNTKLKFWADYKGNVYKRHTLLNNEKLWWRDQKGQGGINLSQRVGQNGVLAINAGYGYGANTVRFRGLGPHSTLRSHRGDLSGSFSSKTGEIDYAIDMAYGLMNFAHEGNQNVFKLGLKAGQNALSMGVKAQLLHGNHTHGLFDFQPRYAVSGAMGSALIGVNASVMANENKAFNLSPNVVLGFNPSPFFNLSLKAMGGVAANSWSQIYAQIPWMLPQGDLPVTRVPVNAELRITFGPLRGTYLSLAGAYARANDWLMPMDDAMYATVDLRGYKLEIEAGTQLGQFGSLSASYSTTPGHDLNHGWMGWRDRARHVAKACLTLTPSTQWKLEADYQIRFQRHVYAQMDMQPVSLGTAAGLDVSLSFQATKHLQLFGKALNMLTRYAMDPGYHARQGATALFGAKLTF